MRIILKGRQGGKTTELIKRSAETGAVIVCHDARTAHMVKNTAYGMGLTIPEPWCYNDILSPASGVVYGKARQEIMIDNADMFIRYCVKAPLWISCVTLSCEEE